MDFELKASVCCEDESCLNNLCNHWSMQNKNCDFYVWNFCRFCLKCWIIWDLIVQRKVWIGEHWQFILVPKVVIRAQHTSKSSSGSKTSYPETSVEAWDSSSSALQPWVGLGLLKRNVTSDPYPGQLPANFYNPVSLCLPLPCQSVLILVSHILIDLQALSIVSF